VIIEQIHVVNVAGFETKNDPPIGPHCNAPKISKISLQRMQPETGQVHIGRLSRAIQNGQNILDFRGMIGADSFSHTLFK
jgi:hypothetical protein